MMIKAVEHGLLQAAGSKEKGQMYNFLKEIARGKWYSVYWV
jgi:hypothetical protein